MTTSVDSPPRRKAIRSTADLAINGAAPAFAEPLHVGRPNLGDRELFLRYAADLYDRRWLTNNGPLVQELERSIAAHVGVAHCVCMCNGTVALEIAIRALGLSGEVIVPSYTFIATAHALHWQGITPVFVDIDRHSLNIDPQSARTAITARTTGIIGVHLWGRPAPVEALQALAEEYDLQLLFDAAHGFDCSLAGRKIGGFGRCEVFSFHATKVFNTFEGGAVVTNDGDLAERMRLMRNFGFVHYDKVIHPGTNGKMPEICAAAGLVNLHELPAFIAINRRNYLAYRGALSSIPGLSVIDYDEADTPNFQYVVVEVDAKAGTSRDELVATLHAENVLARRYFWPGCHRMLPYRKLFPDAGARLPVTEDVAARLFVLPNGSEIDDDKIRTICDVLAAAMS